MPLTPTRNSTSQPHFLEFNGRRLFALQILPTCPSRGAVLYLPPFAEEMNRCRSHVAAQARAFAAAGLRTLILDPYGTGESDGDIADADWSIWLQDAIAAARWLEIESGHAVTLWGMRTGALLAAEVADSGEVTIPHLLFWQPVLDGKLFLNQYLRLRIASQLVNETDRESTEQIRDRLSNGEVIEVAGYPLTSALSENLATRRMSDFPALAHQRISWIEVVSKADQQLSLPSRKLVDALRTQGATVNAVTVACPMIWQLHERADAPALRDTTLRLFGLEP
ncbi:MAG: hydrolase 2, exosortase A system-associated [Thauera propionica]|jgi:exosortase A-associated hydrolase 2|nr:hydrolase 2, exosortase A system-associated [Thauera propionica]